MKRISLLLMTAFVAAVSVSLISSHVFRAQTSKSACARCCGSQSATALREVDFPYYNLSNGWISTLNLVSDSPKPLDFTLAIKGKLGEVLTTAETIQPSAKLAIDLGSRITQLGGDTTGAFAEGSVAVYFTGTIMPLVGQITLTNPTLSLVHESVMVEHDPGRSDIPAELDGLWWGLGVREARVMVSNTSAQSQSAQIYLDFQGQRHPLPAPLTFLPYETKALDIGQLLASLGVSPAQAPEGGISIIQTGPQPALIANGRITDAATGFSSTIDFLWTAMQQTNISALHASGLPIGTPSANSPFAGAGTFIPHVVVRDLTGAAQTVNITVEYPQPSAVAAQSASPAAPARNGKFIPAPAVPGDDTHHPEWGSGTGATVGTLALGPFPVPAYSSVDYSLASAMSQLPPSLPFCSIRIQYSDVPANENWTTGEQPDYSQENWGQNPTQNGNAPGGLLTDILSQYNTATKIWYPNPGCVQPPNPPSTTKVNHWGQEFYAGSLTSGTGAPVQTDTLQKYLDNGRHTPPINSPVQ